MFDLFGVAVGLTADMALGEPKVEPHPVAAFGSLMSRVEKKIWADNRLRGTGHLLIGSGVAALLGTIIPFTSTATYLASAPRGLLDAASRIERALSNGEIDEAKRLLPWLVGRDPTHLTESEIARAVIESLAESTVDAIVAPAFWGVLLGAQGALVHRAVNTLDSMVGHHSARFENFGWASARCDDVMAYVPARLAGLMVCLHFPGRSGEIFRIIRRDAGAHPSPNAGVIEAAFAGALRIQLGGLNTYGDGEENRPLLGDGPKAQVAAITAALQLVRRITWTVVGLCSASSLILATVGRRGLVSRKK